MDRCLLRPEDGGELALGVAGGHGGSRTGRGIWPGVRWFRGRARFIREFRTGTGSANSASERP